MTSRTNGCFTYGVVAFKHPPMTDTISPDILEPVSFRRAASDPDGFARDLGRSFREIGFAVVC